jgi:YggT family protein
VHETARLRLKTLSAGDPERKSATARPTFGGAFIPSPCRPTGAPMIAVYNLINTVITIYIWLLIAMVVLSLLVSFNMVNTGNRFIYTIGDFLHRITEPLLRPIRNILPNLGGIDISPMVLILALYFIRDLAFQFLVM